MTFCENQSKEWPHNFEYIVLVMAAGCGTRFDSDIPKQYAPLKGKTVLWHSINSFNKIVRQPKQTYIVLASDDVWFDRYDWSDLRCKPLRVGGEMRQDSVLAGLIATHITNETWVLVHDGVRPCLKKDALIKFLRQMAYDDVGGFWGIPLNETLKDIQDDHSIKTVSRHNKWIAQTPQMFRGDLLIKALKQSGHFPDEASAIETLGYQPKCFWGDMSNIKITYPTDLEMANKLLRESKP